MAEITLEELRGKRQQETLAAQKAPETAVKEMEKQELTPEERERVEQIKEQIDVTDSQMLMQFGSGAKQNIAEYSEQYPLQGYRLCGGSDDRSHRKGGGTGF